MPEEPAPVRPTIKFRDLVAEAAKARLVLANQKERLNKLKGRRTSAEDEDFERIQRVLRLAPDHDVDPLFVAFSHLCHTKKAAGLEGRSLSQKGGEFGAEGGLSAEELTRVALLHGLLALDVPEPPRVVVDEDTDLPTPDRNDPCYEPMVAKFFAALGEAEGLIELAERVLLILANEGWKGADAEVDSREFARVMRCLAKRRVTIKERQLKRRVTECLDAIQRTEREVPVSETAIELPDLNAVTEYQIQKENVEAIGPMVCAAMLDELKAFQVVDKLVELWQRGMLPIGHGAAGRMLYDHWKSAATRMSDAERQNFYAVTIGIPGGAANGSTNREFNDLWIRFVSSVSALVRQQTVDSLLRANVPSSVSQQQVRKAARDLALNLSLHGYGIVNYAARDLQDQIKKMIELLSDPEIRATYGAKDMWQVIDQVATLELGGARNSARYRTLATCGAIITKWLSQNVRRFNSATSFQPVIDVNEVTSPTPRSAGADATKRPFDYDLVNACELWLADTATSEDRVEEMSQPRESPAMTSAPVPIPSLARDMMEALPPGLGFGVSARR